MPVDLTVFERQKSIVDQQQLQDAFNMKKALAASQIQSNQQRAALDFDQARREQQLLDYKMQEASKGGNLPAPLQLANEYRRLLDAQDDVGAAQLLMFAKAADKGVVPDGLGGYAVAPGYAESVASIAAVKAGEQRQAQKNVDVTMNPLIAGGESLAKAQSEAKVEKLTKNNEDLKKLRSIENNLDQYSEIAKGTPFTGPVLGRIGDIIKAPSRTDLNSAANELTLRAKELLNFPNANFSNTDLQFIRDVSGGQYAQYGGIEKVIARLRETTQKQIDNILQSDQLLQTPPGIENPSVGGLPPAPGGTPPAVGGQQNSPVDYKSKYGLK
jgi:hypothetical protein